MLVYGWLWKGYNQIVVDPKDQEKKAFTCPFGVFAYRRIPFGLCNALATSQRYVLSIFADMVEKCIEVILEDFSSMVYFFNLIVYNLIKCDLHDLVDKLINFFKVHFSI